MKRFFLALILLCSFLQSTPGFSENPTDPYESGSSNVYLKISRFDFSISTKSIVELGNEKLYDLFESNQQPNAYVIYIDPYLFARIHFRNCWGYTTGIGFEGLGIIVFQYFREYKATVGVNADNELFILVPKSVNGNPPMSICNWDAACDDLSDSVFYPPN